MGDDRRRPQAGVRAAESKYSGKSAQTWAKRQPLRTAERSASDIAFVGDPAPRAGSTAPFPGLALASGRSRPGSGAGAPRTLVGDIQTAQMGDHPVADHH